MSNVLNAVIIVDVPLDDEEMPPGFFDPPLPVLGARTALERFRRMDHESAGGYKALEVDIFGCTYNYGNEEEILTWFRNLKWREGLEALLILSPQGGGFIMERTTT